MIYQIVPAVQKEIAPLFPSLCLSPSLISNYVIIYQEEH